MNIFRWLGMFPSRWLLASVTAYSLNLVFGPYMYRMESGWGSWCFLGWLFFLLWAGLFIGENSRSLNHGIKFGCHRLSQLGEIVLLLIGLVLLAASIYNLKYYLEVAGGGLGLAAGEARHQLDLLRMEGFQRPLLVRVADGLSNANVVVSVILLSSYRLHYGLSIWIALSSPIIAAITQLLSGGRNGAAFILCTLAMMFLLRRHVKMSASFGIRLIMRILLIFGLSAFVVMILMFAWRAGIERAEDLEVTTPGMWNGQVELREVYAKLNQLCGGRLSGVYMLSYYASHSGPFFTVLFEGSDYSQPYGGLFHFRPYVLAFGGGSQVYIDMVHAQPFYGLYPTAMQGLLLDFGVWGAMVAAMVIGLMIGVIANQAMRGGPIAGSFLPVLLVAVVISPIYYFSWGGADFALTLLVIIIALLLLTGVLTGRSAFRRGA